MNRSQLSQFLGRRVRRVLDGAQTRLSGIILHRSGPVGAAGRAFFLGPRIGNATLVVTGGALGERGPSGVLLNRLLHNERPTILVSSTGIQREGLIGDFQIQLQDTGKSRRDLYLEIGAQLAYSSVGRILCAPFGLDDLRTAVAAADITGAPLALYLVSRFAEPHSWELEQALREALAKSRIRFAPTEDLRAYYQKRYGHKIWILPPVIHHGTHALTPRKRPPVPVRQGVILGSVSDLKNFDQLRQMVRNSGVKFTWCRSSILLQQKSDLANDGITVAADSSEERAIRAAAEADFALIIDSSRAEGIKNQFSDIAQLENLFLAVSAGLPAIVLSNQETEAGRFVEAFGLGKTSTFSEAAVKGLVPPELTSEETAGNVNQMVKNLAPLASAQTVTGILWESLQRGTLIDEQFEKVFGRIRDKLTPYVDSEAPDDIYWEFKPHYQALMRIRATNYQPNFIFDVGASTGYWSHIAHRVFSEARFYLVDPLMERYLDEAGEIYRMHPEFTKIAAAAGDQPGEITLNVSEDLYGSSLFDATAFPDGRRFTAIKVPLRTIDEIAQTENIQGRGILKIDAQFAEHLVLQGAAKFLQRIDFILMEVSLRRFTGEVKILDEFISLLKELAFHYYDFAGDWRDPATGELLQHDVIFARDRG